MTIIVDVLAWLLAIIGVIVATASAVGFREHRHHQAPLWQPITALAIGILLILAAVELWALVHS